MARPESSKGVMRHICHALRRLRACHPLTVTLLSMTKLFFRGPLRRPSAAAGYQHGQKSGNGHGSKGGEGKPIRPRVRFLLFHFNVVYGFVRLLCARAGFLVRAVGVKPV